MSGRDDKSAEEARRILDRVKRDGDSSAFGLVTRGAHRVRDHVAAQDADQDDPIEVWGTRIARTVGFVVLLAIMAWLLLPVLRGG